MTPAQKALVRIAALCRRPNHRITRQIRLLELALEGLGVPTALRDEEIRKVIQERRDLAQQRVAANAGGRREAA